MLQVHVPPDIRLRNEWGDTRFICVLQQLKSCKYIYPMPRFINLGISCRDRSGELRPAPFAPLMSVIVSTFLTRPATTGIRRSCRVDRHLNEVVAEHCAGQFDDDDGHAQERKAADDPVDFVHGPVSPDVS